MKKIYTIDNIDELVIEITKPSIVFLKGDLGAGKTTLSKHIINNILKINQDVTSPTYTYYNKYETGTYHFDLYRLKQYDEFFAIGGEDILDNLEGVALIEWPEVISDYYKADIEIHLNKTLKEGEREIELIYN